MNAAVSAEQIDRYRRDGFLAIPDFLSADELEAWRGAVTGAVTARDGRPRPDTTDRAGDSYYDQVFIQRLNLWQDHPGVRRLLLDERIGKLCCDLEGLDGIRIWHDQALIKAPWANPTSWHLDCPYWSFSHRQAVSIWIALDDATLENGCMWYVPGTHRDATFDNVGIGNNMGDLFKKYPAWRERTSVPAPLPAGGAALHNGLLAHGAGANMTRGWRRAMTCAFMPDGAVYNGQHNILPERLVATLAIGDPLTDPDQNPLMWSASGAHTESLARLLSA